MRIITSVIYVIIGIDFFPGRNDFGKRLSFFERRYINFEKNFLTIVQQLRFIDRSCLC